MSDVFGRPHVAASALPVPRMSRRVRRPTHNAYLHFTPWVIQPFCVMPVLPGETLKNLMMQGRVLTTPILNNQVTGWWFEQYWFFVKHRHMASAESYMSMMLSLADNTEGAAGSADAAFNMHAGDLQFTMEAYEAVVNEFFRGSEEAYGTAGSAHTNGLAYARLKLPGWWDSILPATALSTEPAGDTIGGADLNQVGELAQALETWQTMRMLNITTLEYDDWLRSFGVKIAAPREDKPELIRYSREWQYPSSAVSVDATAQRVSTVLNWSITERADKNRFFKEPGVILGVAVVRPKLYHDRQQAGVGLLRNSLAWQTPFGRGTYRGLQPIHDLSGYVFDTQDLFNQGDQFVYIERGTGIPRMAFPADGVFDYPNATLINSLFADGSSGHIKMDAAVTANIATGAVGPDTTPTTQA